MGPRRAAALVLSLACAGCVEAVAPEAQAPAERCGDGVFEPSVEPCDASGAGSPRCLPSCALDPCGDGDVDPDEACDDGPDGSARCTSGCVVQLCGNAILDAGEECDPGLDPACGSDCVGVAVCGDGVPDANEACDEGPANGRAFSTCTQDCTIPTCGDGLLAAPDEQCDGGPGCTGCRFDGCAAIAAIATEAMSVVALADGRLFATGDLLHAGLTDLRPPDEAPGLVELPGAPAFVLLAGRTNAVAGLTGEGALWLFGDDGWGRRGGGVGAWDGTPPTPRFSEPMPGRRFVDVAATDRGFLALERGGGLWTFGGDPKGALLSRPQERQSCSGPSLLGAADGVCLLTPALAPPPIEGYVPVRLFAGDEHAGSLDAQGVTWLWGSNAWWQLGSQVREACPSGEEAHCAPPVRLQARGLAATASSSATVFVGRDGGLWGFGRTANFGLPGEGTFATQAEPARIEAGEALRFVEVQGAGTYVVARSRDGRLYGSGESDRWQLGPDLPVAFHPLVPIELPPGAPFVAVSAARWHALGLRADGTVLAWGDRGGARLGDPMVPLLDGLAASATLQPCP